LVCSATCTNDSRLLIKELADYLQRDPGTVSRFESGFYPIRRPDLVALLKSRARRILSHATIVVPGLLQARRTQRR
jgi:hypothetical protein